MLTKEDKGWIVDNFAIKKEMYLVRDELKADISEIKKGMDKVLNAVDKISGNMADLQQENKMGAIALNRHKVQIHELAAATSTVISE